jgi:hypothetical protein
MIHVLPLVQRIVRRHPFVKKRGSKMDKKKMWYPNILCFFSSVLFAWLDYTFHCRQATWEREKSLWEKGLICRLITRNWLRRTSCQNYSFLFLSRRCVWNMIAYFPLSLTLRGREDVQIQAVFAGVLQEWKQPFEVLQTTARHLLQRCRLISEVG